MEEESEGEKERGERGYKGKWACEVGWKKVMPERERENLEERERKGWKRRISGLHVSVV